VRHALWTRLFLSILATLAVSFGVLYLFTMYSLNTFVSAEIDRTLARDISFVRRELAERQDVVLRSLSQPASAAPVHERIEKRDTVWLDDAVSRWREQLPTVDTILLFDREDRPITPPIPSPAALQQFLPLLRQARETGAPYTGTELVYCNGFPLQTGQGEGNGHYRLASVVVLPVRSPTQTFLGSIVAIDLFHGDDHFLEGLLPVVGSNVVIGISQQGGTIAGTSPLADGHLSREAIGQLEQGRQAVTSMTREGRQYRSISTPLFNARRELIGAITLSLPVESFRTLSLANRRNISLAFLIGIALSLSLAFIIARRLTRPLRGLTEGVRRIQDGNFEGRVDVTSSDEIGVLTEAFNRMVSTLGDRTRTIETKTAMLMDLNETLELRVAERSRELADRTLLQEQIISVITDGVMVVDAAGRPILMNHSAASLFGIELDGPLPPFEVLCAAGEFCRIGDTLEKVRRTGERARTRIEAKGKFIEADLAPIQRDGIVETVVISLHDVTMRETIDRLKSDFIATVSHELKTPLTSIRGALQFILSKSRWLTGTERELLEICSRNTERLIRLITGILDITQIEQGAVPFDRQVISPGDVVTDATSALRGMALEQNVAITTFVDSDLPLIRGDHDRLVQVLTNLLSNAINFSDEGKVVRVSVRSEGGSVIFAVQDMNRTIPESERHKLFQKFQQIDQGEGGRLGGSGLGLAISREIVERHGGRIWYAPLLAGGNEFVFSLPTEGDGNEECTNPDRR